MPEIVIEARPAALGPAMQVKRILPFRLRRMVGPFIFMDHAGPVQLSGSNNASIDVLPHPHIGLSTVSYLFDGKVTHRDSLGVQQVIVPGEVNWMTAGSGISHSERFEDPAALAGGLELIQTWVALPEALEEEAPSFTNYKAREMPVFSESGCWYRLIAGSAFGMHSPVKTDSPLIYMHVVPDNNSIFRVPQGYSERGVYIARGSVEHKGIVYPDGNLIVFRKEEDPAVKAIGKTTLMLLGGEPLGFRHIWWNFVSSRKERIEQAKADWKEGRIILPPADNHEFVPLPEDKRNKPGGPAPQVLS